MSIDADQLTGTIKTVARAVLESVPGAGASLPEGVRLLDSWSNKRDGAVLFWIEQELDPHRWGQATLHHERFELDKDCWHPAGGGGHSCETAEVLLGRMGPGLHRLGAGYRDPVRVTMAIASREVVTIELRTERGSTTRRPGADGFCIFGITFSDPITYAHPLYVSGQSLGEPLIL
jgi:hypothetical protein